MVNTVNSLQAAELLKSTQPDVSKDKLDFVVVENVQSQNGT